MKICQAGKPSIGVSVCLVSSQWAQYPCCLIGYLYSHKLQALSELEGRAIVDGPYDVL